MKALSYISGDEVVCDGNDAYENSEMHLILALFGWERKVSSNNICCSLCQRSLGLWNFSGPTQKKKIPEEEEEYIAGEEGARPIKKARVATVGTFKYGAPNSGQIQTVNPAFEFHGEDCEFARKLIENRPDLSMIDLHS